ncbi:MAG: hypothetical protein HKN44_04715 [Ilumatobacter sp.]|nr:hypothetical protein [Ilumatobacter sp.]
MNAQSMRTTLGQKVIAVDSAEDLGDVKTYVVSPDVERIEKIQIAGRKKHALFTAWRDLASFGADAVMVTAAEAPAESDDERDLGAAKGDIALLDARIVDTAGFEHGTVSDVTFDADSGSIVSVEGSDGTTYPHDAVASLGSYALVVRA